MQNQNFTIREMDKDLDLKNINGWIRDNPVKTHFFNAMSTLFPLGEGFFIWSVRKFQHVADENLRKQIQAFYQQEGNHSFIHDIYNRELKAQGYFTDRMDRQLAKKVNFSKKYLSARFCLAITAATEHYTAVLGDKVLQGKLLLEKDTDQQMLELWRWHAIEEVEHKSVAMDVFIKAGGKHYELVLAMIVISFDFWIDTFIRLGFMLNRDKMLFRWSTVKSFGSVFFGKDGVFPVILSDTLKFFKKGFHPSQISSPASP